MACVTVHGGGLARRGPRSPREGVASECLLVFVYHYLPAKLANSDRQKLFLSRKDDKLK